jgi:WD40 repeat protein
MPRLVRPRAGVRLRPIGTFQLDEYIHAVMFSPDGSRLAAADASGQVAVWNVASQRCVSRRSTHQGAVLAEGWHPGGKNLATAGEDGVGRVWDAGSGEERAVVPVGDGKGWVEHLVWESGGERLAMAAGKTLQVLKWSESGVCSVEWEMPQHKSSVSDLCWRKGYPGQIFSSCFGGATLWQVGTDSPVNTFPYDGALLALTISADGRYLASGNLDGSVHLWSIATKQHWHMAGYPCKVRHVVFDPYGEYLWTAAGPDLVTWSAQKFEGSSGRLLSGHLGWIQAIACHPRQRVVASVGEDGLLCLWELGTSKPIVSQELRVAGGLSCVAWSPNDVCLSAGADDGTVALFAVEGVGEK